MAWQRTIGLDRVPRRFNGADVTVAVVDTGVSSSADLGDRLLAQIDLTADGDGIDRFGHGTHLAGVIAGDGTVSSGTFQGVARDASIVGVKVAGWDGATDVTTVIAGIRWAIAHRSEYGIRVLNLSYGTDADSGTGSDPLDAAVEEAWRAGIVVVVAAGNRGGSGTIGKPGDDPYVITVGAVDAHGTASPADDEVAPFSSAGPTADGVAKPDLLAPGVSIVGVRAPGSTIDTLHPAARNGDGYLRGSGTSQAAAIVSGVVAEMLDAGPDLTPDEVKGILLATADAHLAVPQGGPGVVDAAAAVAAATLPRSRVRTLTPIANEGLVPSTGLGPIDASRGTQRAVVGLPGSLPVPLVGEVDALGDPWAPWSADGWSDTRWAGIAGLVGGRPVPRLAWDGVTFGLDGVPAAWDARYWGARYWGARYWGAESWR